MLIAYLCVQASMSVLGYDVPTADVPVGTSAIDKTKRRDRFKIIHPYIMSPEDIAEVEESGNRVEDLWLESFTATQKGMIGTTPNFCTKQYFQDCFPSKGLIPNKKYGFLVGLPAGSTILQRYAVTVTHVLQSDRYDSYCTQHRWV